MIEIDMSDTEFPLAKSATFTFFCRLRTYMIYSRVVKGFYYRGRAKIMGSKCCYLKQAITENSFKVYPKL